MEKVGKVKKLNNKEKAAIEREKLKAELLESYVEGKSNLEYDKLDADEVWKIAYPKFSTLEEKEKAYGKPLPLITKEEWLERDLAKVESERSEIPSHKVQDPEALIAKYRQKFVQATKELHPQSIEDLRAAAPYFKALFSNKPDDKYINVFEKLRSELIWHWRVYPRQQIPDGSSRIDQSYIWGMLQDVCRLADINYSLTFVEKSSTIPDNITDSIEYGKIEINGFTNVIKRTFEEIADDQNLVLYNYFSLQRIIYDWANKYHLKKDWLIDYAHYIIHQFSRNPDIKTQDIEIGTKNYSHYRTYFSPFEFEAEGWWASENGETAKQYAARITKEFQEKLESYIQEASKTSQLAKLPKFTKPPTYENVEWLVCWTVKGWSAETIVEKFFEEISISRTNSAMARKAFESKKKYVQKEIKTLAVFGLPIRKNSLK